MKSEECFVIGIILLFLINFSFVSAEMLVSDAGVQYEQKILDYFNNRSLVEEEITNPLRPQAGSLEIVDNETFVRVLIDLKDPSKSQEFVSSFQNLSFNDVVVRSVEYGISVKVDEETFNQIIQDERVGYVYYNAPIYAQNNKSPNIVPIMLILTFVILVIAIVSLLKRKDKFYKH